MKTSPGSVFIGAAVMAVVAATVAGLLALGSPTEERARRIDDRRVADLQGIKAATDLYWTRHSGLPPSLDDLTDEPGVTISTADPDNSEAYGYQPLDSIRYEVCASFERESGEISRVRNRDLWAHGSGRQCFDSRRRTSRAMRGEGAILPHVATVGNGSPARSYGFGRGGELVTQCP